MGEFSIWHWLVVLAVVMLLFGSGKVSGLMGDLAKGIKTFKKTMADDSDKHEPPRIEVAQSIPSSVAPSPAARSAATSPASGRGDVRATAEV